MANRQHYKQKNIHMSNGKLYYSSDICILLIKIITSNIIIINQEALRILLQAAVLKNKIPEDNRIHIL